MVLNGLFSFFCFSCPVQHHPERHAVAEGAGGAANHCGADVSAVQGPGAARHDRLHPTHHEHHHPAARTAHHVSAGIILLFEVCVCYFMYVCVFMCVSVYVCVFMCVCTCKSLCVHVYVHLSACIMCVFLLHVVMVVVCAGAVSYTHLTLPTRRTV